MVTWPCGLGLVVLQYRRKTVCFMAAKKQRETERGWDLHSLFWGIPAVISIPSLRSHPIKGSFSNSAMGRGQAFQHRGLQGHSRCKLQQAYAICQAHEERSSADEGRVSQNQVSADLYSTYLSLPSAGSYGQ